MILTDEIEARVLINDIETIRGCLDIGFYNPDEDKWYEFEISKYKNDLYEFIKFYNNDNWDYIVGYNNESFDAQVLQFVINNYQQWNNLSGLEICEEVYKFTQKLLDDKKHGLFNPYRPENFTIPVLDCFTILGLNNEARWTSLKKAEFQLDFPSVEEMPISHTLIDLTEEDIKNIKSYRRNDVLATYELFKLILGVTEHPVYKGNNQLELRFSIQQEFGINCLNYSDIKIGDELMKKSYAEQKGIKISELPKKGTFRKEIKLKYCIPKYVEFKTPKLQQLLEETKKKTVKQQEKHEVTFNYGYFNTEYTIGLGGGHSTNQSQIFKEDEENELSDLDVASLYPAIKVNEGYYSYHLGKEILKVYTQLYNKRLELKPKSKTDKKIKGICDAIKLILNSFYGKVGSMDSWAYDKQVAYSICLTGQFNLLMLIEEMELNGIYCFSFNTDGATFKLKKQLRPKFEQICKEWEEKTKLILEETKFKAIYYSTVNDYIAFTTEGKMKTKGDCISDFELFKNKSYRIVALAVQEYFKNGKNPEEFIKNWANIYDFCIMAKASGNLYLEEQWEENGKLLVKKHQKLIRYYLSTNSKSQLFKRGIGSTGKSMNVCQNAANELGEIYIQYFNQFENKDNYYIDYNQYIFKAYKLIDKIQKTKLSKSFVDKCKNNNKLTLF